MRLSIMRGGSGWTVNGQEDARLSLNEVLGIDVTVTPDSLIQVLLLL